MVFVGSIKVLNSLRLVDFDVRNEIVREATARVREAAKSRAPIGRKVPKVIRAFLGDTEPVVVMRGSPVRCAAVLFDVSPVNRCGAVHCLGGHCCDGVCVRRDPVQQHHGEHLICLWWRV